MEASEKAQATNAGAFFAALKSACPSIRMRGGDCQNICATERLEEMYDGF